MGRLFPGAALWSFTGVKVAFAWRLLEKVEVVSVPECHRHVVVHPLIQRLVVMCMKV